MKSPEQWLDEIGLICVTEDLRQHRINQIKRYQLDALEHVASLLTANADSPTRGFKAIWKDIQRLRREIEPANGGAEARRD